MWDCVLCGCKMIAADLLKCPMCQREREVPKVTSGGSSNAAEEAPEPVAPVADSAPEPVVAEPVSEPEAPETPEPEPEKDAEPEPDAKATPEPESERGPEPDVAPAAPAKKTAAKKTAAAKSAPADPDTSGGSKP